MLEQAKIVKADFYIDKSGKSQVETLELKIETTDQQEKIIVAKGRLLIDAVHQVITLRHISLETVHINEYISQLEGLPVRVDVIDGEIIALLNHLRKYVVFVKNGEVVF